MRVVLVGLVKWLWTVNPFADGLPYPSLPWVSPPGVVEIEYRRSPDVPTPLFDLGYGPRWVRLLRSGTPGGPHVTVCLCV